MKKYMSCVARGNDDHWLAVCLDLDIMVEGTSLEEVQETLRYAVRTYIEDAMKEDEPSRTGLLNRRAPFFVRLAWTWPFFVISVFGRSRDENNRPVRFTAACSV